MTWGVTSSKPDQVKSVSGAIDVHPSGKAELEPKTYYASTRAYICAGMVLVCGILAIIAGICQEFAMYRIFHSFHGYSIWTGVLFTLAGICSALACSKQNKSRLISATVFNILTAIVAIMVLIGFAMCIAKGMKYKRAMEMREKWGDQREGYGKMSGWKWNKDDSGDEDDSSEDSSEDGMGDWDRRHGKHWPHKGPCSHRPWPRSTGRPWPRSTRHPRPRPTSHPWDLGTGSWRTARPVDRTGTPNNWRTGRPDRTTRRRWPRPTRDPSRPRPSRYPTGEPQPERYPWMKGDWDKKDWAEKKKKWMEMHKEWMEKHGGKDKKGWMDKRKGKDGSMDWMQKKAGMMEKYKNRWEMKMMCVSSIIIVILVVIELVNSIILCRYGVRSLRAAKYVMMSEPVVMTPPAATAPTDPEKKILAELEDLPIA